VTAKVVTERAEHPQIEIQDRKIILEDLEPERAAQHQLVVAFDTSVTRSQSEVRIEPVTPPGAEIIRVEFAAETRIGGSFPRLPKRIDRSWPNMPRSKPMWMVPSDAGTLRGSVLRQYGATTKTTHPPISVLSCAAMTAITLDGEALATIIKHELRERIATLGKSGIQPGLGTLLVGDDGPSARYVSMKHKDCAELGIRSFDARLSATASEADVRAVIQRFNADPAVHAYILQYPFPKGLNYEKLLLEVLPEKDADGLHPVNLGHLVMGVDAPLACTPRGIQLLLERHQVPIAGQHVVIVGRGLTIGRPLANLLTLKRSNANAAVTVVHTGINDIGTYTRQADILVAAAGVAGLIQPNMVKAGAAVVAAGVSFDGKRILSDVADEVAEVAGWLSPRIGGVGPMTRALLLSNTVAAAERTQRTS
jgi:methylenetetrahydrofolate dehydrogenase (NADP+) / methenyltetrahydrofolate cyclohydrolase